MLHNLYCKSLIWPHYHPFITYHLSRGQIVTSANGLFERFWQYTVKQEDSNSLFCMTLGTWRWDGEVGIFCLAELYVHITDYDIERDAQFVLQFVDMTHHHPFISYNLSSKWWHWRNLSLFVSVLLLTKQRWATLLQVCSLVFSLTPT